MQAAMRGECIAQGYARFNARERTGAETLRGSIGPAGDAFGRLRADQFSREPMDTLRRRRVRRLTAPPEEARERSSGGIPNKVYGTIPCKGENPREQPVIGELNPRPIARDSRKG
jgi:hypothetical protein